jgi:hypothetical protein
VTYTAYFNTTKYQYTITFKNDDNSDLWAGLVDAGTTGAELQALFEQKYNEKTGSTVPQKAPTVDKVFTFTGWNTTLATVTAAATYTANYTWVTRKYHVTFYNYDAVSVLYEADVNYNTAPTYSGVTPFRANTSAYSYNWTGWQQGATTYTTSATLPVVKGDISYIATFTQTELKYQVFFKRQDGSIIDAPFFSYEETPTAFPANPTLASTVSTDYTFDHWDPAELVPVTEDGKVYTAYFSESPRQYTAHFVNYDGTTLGVDQTIDYNTIPEYTGATPFKPNDSRNSFEFSGWAWEAGTDWEAGSIGVGEALPAIKGEITFKAQFNSVLLQFNVIYKREDGTIIEQQKKKWGETTAFPSPVASYEDETYTYTFDHWSPATVVTPVTTDATYTAYFNQSIKTYTISSIATTPDGYGTVSPASVTGIPSGSSVTVNGNKFTVNGTTVTATPTAADAQYTYAFDHWNNVPNTVTADVANITVEFTRTTNTYTVTWKNGDTTLETDENVEYGTTPKYDGATPTKAGNADNTYTFNGWTPAVGAITGTTVYTATYTSNPTVASVTAGGVTTYYATVANAITAANGKTNATVTILKNAPVASEQTITAAMTIDLNGKTITSTQTAAEKGVFKINASGKTVTITDSGTNGKIDHTASCAGKLYGISIIAGLLEITGGTIYAENTNATGNSSYRAYGINTQDNATSITISAGTIEAKRENNSYVYGIYTNNACALTMTGGAFIASGSTYVRGIYVKGTTSLTNATITATGSSTNAVHIGGGTTTIYRGWFKGTDNVLYKSGGSVSVQGGYYSNNSEDLAGKCATN